MATNTINGNVHLYPSAIALPHTHNPDCIVVISNGPSSWNRQEPYPFASIVALPGGEPIGARPRSCIHVTVENQDFYIRNGLIAIERDAPMLVCLTPFPELAGHLRKNPEGLKELIDVRPHEKPWTSVKNFHQADSDFVVREGAVGPCESLNALAGWNRFEKKGLSWPHRVDHAFGVQTGTASQLEATQKKLERLCRTLGLKRGKMTSFSVQELELHTCIEIALRLARDGAAL